jgi:hypothetical protein
MAIQKTNSTILATIATPFIVTILLLIFSLLGLNTSNPQPYGNPIYDFSGVLIKVTAGHLLTFILTILYLYKYKKANFLPIAIAAIITQVFWRLVSNLAYLDCESGNLCSQKVTDTQNMTITYIVSSLLIFGVTVFYLSFVHNKK